MIAIDHDRGEVKIKGRHLALTPKEYELIRALAGADGRILDRGQLAEAMAISKEGYDRLVDQHVARLRRKVRAVSKEAAARIATVTLRGYKLLRK